MYLINYRGKKIRTDNAVYVKHLNDTAYVVTDKLNAEGVCYNGIPMMYADGAIVSQFDAGYDMDVMEQTEAGNKTALENAICENDAVYAAEMANLENAMCEQDGKENA